MENELRFAGWLIRRIGDEISVCAPEATPGMVHVKNKGSLVNRLLYALSDALLTSDQSLSARASAGEGGDAILSGLLDYIDAETCTHEETHRGGAIWTICDGCDRKWADDEGGFVPHEDAPAVAAARKYLAAAPQPAQAGASGGGVDEKHLADCLLMTGHLGREQAEEVASKLRAFVFTPASPATGGDPCIECGADPGESCYPNCCTQTPQPAGEGVTDEMVWEAQKYLAEHHPWYAPSTSDEVRELLKASLPNTTASPATACRHEWFPDPDLGEGSGYLYCRKCDVTRRAPKDTTPPAHDSDDCSTCDSTGREGGDGSPMPCSDCGGSGCIPSPLGDWHEPSTPPAHGDGEGDDDDDDATEPTELQIEYARGYGDGIRDAERIAATRPAPEAQEARDAARYRWLRSVGFSFAHDEQHRGIATMRWGDWAYDTDEGHATVCDAAIDKAIAALALPAQGREGE